MLNSPDWMDATLFFAGQEGKRESKLLKKDPKIRF